MLFHWQTPTWQNFDFWHFGSAHVTKPMIHTGTRIVSTLCFSQCYVTINSAIIACVGGSVDTLLWELTVRLSHNVVTCQLPF